ncbi:murein hydrolase activator EnvC family protein [Candidatus Palauibacter sp.]|uniref:murein hydrolase activator EnvC family protein n=1 Tax=Candidatus Palauibacter sp. TaxID=3101350 RepID=UPI003B59CF7D
MARPSRPSGGRSPGRPGGLRRRAWAGRLVGAVTFAVATSPTWTAPLPAIAQESPDVRRRLEESEGRLELIREERQRLRRELEGIAGQVTGDSAELVNIERQIAASASLLAEFDVQRLALSEQLTAMTREMLLTRDELAARQVVLRARLRDIYKRGPLRTVEVLLSSRSFSDLLNRYRYLRDVAVFDRILVEDVKELEDTLAELRGGLSREGDRIARVRAENRREYDELERLERQRQERLRRFADRRDEAQSTLARLAAEEAELRALMAGLEERRRSAEREAGAASVSSLTTGDLGSLAWPVEGEVLWRFGPEREGRTTIPREGIGIAAPRGTPVSAVDRGTVASVAARASGLTVILDHGGGFYSSYQKLRDVTVREGQAVGGGQAIGHVGGDATRPHIEFQIYEPGTVGPRAVDPVRWLRGRP